ncbi:MULTISPECIES: hypothetical protein [Nitrosomonas]|uniref:hypothetical protein n=1 Tax=Nitrosomonas TaxID=914 RepID=UPI0023F2D87B|nr:MULTISPECIES: hypothetical protein [Nitrosomonas]MEB2330835.1 hypothetical protein [Nitrosomonas sp.]
MKFVYGRRDCSAAVTTQMRQFVALAKWLPFRESATADSRVKVEKEMNEIAD